MSQKPFLNAGCGRVILPAPKPAHYGLIDDGVCDYALWTNVDRNMQPGVDVVADLFKLPWDFEDNSFDGALLGHWAEHIPHEIRLAKLPLFYNDKPEWWHRRGSELACLQDGWYAVFAELHRVLTPGSIIHVLSPYAWSQGGVTDPTHTRLLTEQSFTHSMQPDPNSPFAYATGGLNLELVEPARYTFTSLAQPYMHDQAMLQRAMQTQVNMVYELYVKLRVVK